MTREQIIKQAFELGMMIADSQERQAMESKQNEIRNDSDAFDMLARFQMLKARLDEKRSQGYILDDTDRQAMQEIQAELGSNRMIQEFGALKEQYDNLIDAVHFAMNQAIADGNKSNCGDCDPATSNCATCTNLS